MKDLEKAGIPPADVIYMTHGIEITGSSKTTTGGVKPKFIMFNGQMLLDDAKIIRSSGSNGTADCTYPSVAGFLSAVGERKY